MALCNTYTFDLGAYPSFEPTVTNTTCFAIPAVIDCGTVRTLYKECGTKCIPIPYVQGDVIAYQFTLPDRLNDWATGAAFGIKDSVYTADWLIALYIVDQETGVETPYYPPNGYVGYLSRSERRIQAFEYDTTDAPACFAIRVDLNLGGGQIRTEYTDVYQSRSCVDTVLVTAIVSGTQGENCFGGYYADEFNAAEAVAAGNFSYLGTYFQYVPRYRYKGNMLFEGPSVTYTRTALGYPTQATKQDLWRLVGGAFSQEQGVRFAEALGQGQFIADDGFSVVTLYVDGKLLNRIETTLYLGLDLVANTLPCIDKFGCQ